MLLRDPARLGSFCCTTSLPYHLSLIAHSVLKSSQADSKKRLLHVLFVGGCTSIQWRIDWPHASAQTPALNFKVWNG